MNDIKIIMLKNGGFTIVDSDLFPTLNQSDWYRNSNGYAYRCINKPSEPRKHEPLHKVVNVTPKGMCTDHINGFKLDNTRRNLRSVTKSQNGMNRHKPRNSRAQYKGVSFHPGYWRARIVVNGKEHICYCKTQGEARVAHAEMVLKYHGNYTPPDIVD